MATVASLAIDRALVYYCRVPCNPNPSVHLGGRPETRSHNFAIVRGQRHPSSVIILIDD
jgi:hypothetical protein